MTTKLTKEQEQAVFKYRGKGIKIGRSTESINKKESEKYVYKFYEMLGFKKPVVRFCDSPLQAHYIINTYKGQSRQSDLDDNIGDCIYSRIQVSFIEDIEMKVWANIRDNISVDIRANIRADFEGDVMGNIKANIKDDIHGLKIVGNEVKEENESRYNAYITGKYEVYWILYWKYYYENGLLEKNELYEKLQIVYNLYKNSGFIYAFEKLAIVCNSHSEIYYNDKGQLHNENGMAIKFRDGYGVYMLNGIRMQEKDVMTKPQDLDVHEIINMSEVDRQRELIRKVTPEMILKKTNAKEIDEYTHSTKDNKNLKYKLYAMKFGDLDRKYLKYEHASIAGIYYCRPVPPNVTRAIEGIGWMQNAIEQKEIGNISENNIKELLANEVY